MKKLLIFTLILTFLTISGVAYSYNENSAMVKGAIKSTVAIVSENGIGTGFFVDIDGYIITAKHVVQGLRKVKVYTRDWEIYSGRVVAEHEKQDIAIVKIEPVNPVIILEPAPKQSIEEGDDVYMVGHIFAIPWTLKKGIISRTDWEDEEGWKYIQIDGGIAEGMSGSAVVDHWGRVIGIIVMGMPFGMGNIGFALETNQFVKWVEDIIIKDWNRMNVLISW
jgi:S1-C subfamily serine protease